MDLQVLIWVVPWQISPPTPGIKLRANSEPGLVVLDHPYWLLEPCHHPIVVPLLIEHRIIQSLSNFEESLPLF